MTAKSGSTKKKPEGKVGRPRTRVVPLKTIPTRCPEALHRYLKTIYPLEHPSLTAYFEHILSEFIKQRPWDHGLVWRKPRVRVVILGDGVGSTGWAQVNVQVPKELADRIEKIIMTLDISRAAFLYTAFFWWAMYIKPPRKFLPAIEAAASPKLIQS
jgi:hypothetical protein